MTVSPGKPLPNCVQFVNSVFVTKNKIPWISYLTMEIYSLQSVLAKASICNEFKPLKSMQ